LSATPGSGTGDGVADTVVINGTAGNDTINVTDNNGVVTVTGLGSDVTITGFEAGDHLVINGLGGDDIINAAGLGTGMLLTANGGDGNDVLVGGSATTPCPAVPETTSWSAVGEWIRSMAAPVAIPFFRVRPRVLRFWVSSWLQPRFGGRRPWPGTDR